MKLLHWTPASGGPSHVTLLFGLGLIGGAVETALRQFRDMRPVHFPYDWIDADARAQQLGVIERVVADHAAQGLGQIDVASGQE